MGLRKKMIVLAMFLGNLVEQPTPEVTIQQGTLRGRISTDGDIFEYLGIPYATANDTNRFQAPFPPPTWDGVFNAVNEHHRCFQIFGAVLPLGEEDCLKINVYTPALAAGADLLPVMVFIHGGGFYEGSGNRLLYDPVFFVRQGVVFVSFNYRLGALGFLCLGVEGAPGNAGLKDQLAALRWVNANIRAFGGNPQDVTLFGESAGAASVSHLKLNPLANGLFKRAIAQSGSSLTMWAISGDPVGAASFVAEKLGYYTKDPEELLRIYKNATLKSLVAITRPVKKGSILSNRVVFMPCIERQIPGSERAITENPYDKLVSGNYNPVPTISGFNDREGIILVGKENPHSLLEKEVVFNESLPTDWDIESELERENVSNTLKSLYFGNKKICSKNIKYLADYYTDFYFTVASINEAEVFSRTCKEPQYNYVFKYSGKRNLAKTMSGLSDEPGACHADELFYMFKTNLVPFYITKEDQLIIDRMTTMWTNFAKYGNPTPVITELLPVKWTPSEPNNLKFLTIDSDLSMGPLPHKERFQVWNDTYSKFRRKFYEVGVKAPEDLLYI